MIIVIFFKYIQIVEEELPSPDEPFNKKSESSIIYADTKDSNTGTNIELYKLFDKENRENLKIEELPEYVKWAILSAEDIDFYEHPGFDITSIVKAFFYYAFGIGEERGGSTITQQLIKQTTLGRERTLDRKIREIILAVKVEQNYSKDQILEMYLNVNNYGGNIYGFKTAAKFYFGKKINELTLAEASLLAIIPQSPAKNSPTLTQNPETSKKRALARKDYVLDQMEKYLEQINAHISDDEQIILQEEIDAAKKEELVFKKPEITINAPHFVFYVEHLLLNGEYNDGKPFSINDLHTGGYKIYTSLNYDLQKIAEQGVAEGIAKYSIKRNGHNGATVITEPSTGKILAMVGSKNFLGPDEGTFFNGQVNITTSLQSMGSTMKPPCYEKAFELGIAAPGFSIPDLPIQIGDYRPKNADGSYTGFRSARIQLQYSRNVPAVILEDIIGVHTYINTLIDFGYYTIEKDPTRYGAALVLGGGDVTMLEHAQGYGVFSNGGYLVKLNPIMKITKHNTDTGKDDLIYERITESKLVADPKAIYMVNHILNYKNGGPASYIDGRDYAGKTGTSDMHIDTVYVGYTPDFVIVGWNGNNDNSPMISGSWGENVTKPWVTNLTKAIAPYFPQKSPFMRPSGITSAHGDLMIEGLLPSNKVFMRYNFNIAENKSDNP